MTNKPPLWTRNFILICLSNLFVFTSFYFLLPTLPVFVTDVLRGDESNVGYIIGILSLTAVLVRPLSGYLLDTAGRKKIMFLALVAIVLSMGAYDLVAGLAALFGLRALHGLAWGFSTTGAGTIAADVVPPARRGEGMGYFGLANTLAMAVGPILGLYILGNFGFHNLFLAGLAVAVLGLISVLGISYPEEKSNQKTSFSLGSVFEPKVFSLSAILFFVSLVYGGIVSFITLYSKEIGIANAGTYFLAYAATLLFVRPIAGKIFDKSGPNKIMAVGFISISLSFIILFAAKDLTLFLLSAVAMGVGFGIVHPSAIAMAINRVPPYRRGAANGTIFSAFDLGIGLGSIFLGLLSKYIGLSYMYLACSAIVVVPLCLFYLYDVKKLKAPEEVQGH